MHIAKWMMAAGALLVTTMAWSQSSRSMSPARTLPSDSRAGRRVREFPCSLTRAMLLEE